MIKKNFISLKRVTLSLVISIEFLIGSSLIYKYYQNKIYDSNVLGTQKVSTIDSKTLDIVPSEDFKYYWQYNKDQKIEDNPDWLNKNVTYFINKNGLNDINDYQIEKKSNVFRIITLGDSFTFGHFVNTQDNWTEQLEKQLNNNIGDCKDKSFEVINLGMPGYDVPYIVERYKELGVQYDPDLVLWLESGSGFDRSVELLQPVIDLCSDLVDSKNKEKEDYLYCWKKAESELKEKYNLYDISLINMNYYDRFFSNIENSKVTIAHLYPLEKDEEDIYNLWRERYADVDMSLLIQDLDDKETLPDGHPNESGHKRISNDFFEYLINKKNICQK